MAPKSDKAQPQPRSQKIWDQPSKFQQNIKETDAMLKKMDKDFRIVVPDVVNRQLNDKTIQEQREQIMQLTEQINTYSKEKQGLQEEIERLKKQKPVV